MSRIYHPLRPKKTRGPDVAPSVSRLIFMRCHDNVQSVTFQSSPECRTDTTIRAGTIYIHQMSHMFWPGPVLNRRKVLIIQSKSKFRYGNVIRLIEMFYKVWCSVNITKTYMYRQLSVPKLRQRPPVTWSITWSNIFRLHKNQYWCFSHW